MAPDDLRRPLDIDADRWRNANFFFFFLVVVEMLSLFLFVSPRQRSVSFRNFEPPIRSNEKETMKVSRSVNRFKRLFKRDRERKHQKKRQLWNELNGTHLHCCVIDWERKTARVSPDRCQELGCLEKKKVPEKMCIEFQELPIDGVVLPFRSTRPLPSRSIINRCGRD